MTTGSFARWGPKCEMQQTHTETHTDTQTHSPRHENTNATTQALNCGASHYLIQASHNERLDVVQARRDELSVVAVALAVAKHLMAPDLHSNRIREDLSANWLLLGALGAHSVCDLGPLVCELRDSLCEVGPWFENCKIPFVTWAPWFVNCRIPFVNWAPWFVKCGIPCVS
jgi:hypothetical protein